jgi:hypothetical protein
LAKRIVNARKGIADEPAEEDFDHGGGGGGGH